MVSKISGPPPKSPHTPVTDSNIRPEPMRTDDPDQFEHARFKDTWIAIQYLNVGFSIPQNWERGSYGALATFLSLRGIRNNTPSLVPFLGASLGHLPSDILRHIDTLIPENQRAGMIRTCCRTLSECSPEDLVLRLFERLDPTKIDRLLTELQSSWPLMPNYNFKKNRKMDTLFWDLLKSIIGTDQETIDQLVRVAVLTKGWLLDYASATLKNDPEIVQPAVSNDGLELRFASKNLKNDAEIVLAAVRQNGEALRFASGPLKDNPKIVLAAVSETGWALRYASETLKNNPEIVLAAIHKYVFALKYAGEIPKNNPEIVLTAVRKKGEALEFAGQSMKNNREIVLAAVRQDSNALLWASKTLREDPEFAELNHSVCSETL